MALKSLGTDSTQLLEIVEGDLFSRGNITSRIIEQGFRAPLNWVELGLAIILILLSFWLSAKLMPARSSDEDPPHILRHITQRLLSPVIMLLLAFGAAFAWQKMFHGGTIWLPLLAVAARWMILIRFCLAVLHRAIPNQRFNAHLERSTAMVLWLLFVLWLTGLDTVITDALRNMIIPLGQNPISLYTILTGIVSLSVVVIAALWASSLADNKLMQIKRLDLNLRIVLSKVVKTLLVVIAVLIALPIIGIDLTVLSVFGGALGVGLGFGLQKIASNYISGFIILTDRSIRIGDRLTIEDFTGYVTKITSRFVVLRSPSGTEALVPNDSFISSTVINESYTAKSLWSSLDVQVAYKTQLPDAMAIMQQAALKNDRIEKDPGPSAYLVDFADSGITLRLGFWVKDPENGFLGLKSDILMSIWRGFNENGIEFPFPQRELRILNDESDPIPLEFRTKNDVNPSVPTNVKPESQP